MAQVVALRATCARRSVGCVLVNGRNHVLATGYNGPAAGESHCISNPCAGVDLPSGTGLDACVAIHAEQNALLQCREVWDIRAAYITTSPCIHCVKLFKNTGCRRIVFSEKYSEPHYSSARKEWLGVSEENMSHWNTGDGPLFFNTSSTAPQNGKDWVEAWYDDRR